MFCFVLFKIKTDVFTLKFPIQIQNGGFLSAPFTACEMSSSHRRQPVSMSLSGEGMVLGSVSSQQRCGATDIKALGASQLSGLDKPRNGS